MVPGLPLLVVTVFAAGAVGGTTGLGFAIISVAGMSLVLDPKSAIVLLTVVVPPLMLVQAVYQREHAGPAEQLLRLLVPAVFGVVAGVAVFAVLPSRAVGVLIGILIIIFVGMRLLGVAPRIDPARERVAGPIVGFVGGVLNGASGLSGPLFASYLLSLGVTARRFAFTVSTLFCTMTTIRLAGFAAIGSVTPALFASGVILVAPSLAGQWLGFAFQRRRSDRALELIVLVALVAAALKIFQEAIVS
jgi:uncharacterized membrane protein YfcA